MVVIVTVLVGTLLGAGGMFCDPESTAREPSGRGSVAIVQVRGNREVRELLQGHTGQLNGVGFQAWFGRGQRLCCQHCVCHSSGPFRGADGCERGLISGSGCSDESRYPCTPGRLV